MFVDYYALFEISETSTSEEIKLAFRKQALRWHPDHNSGIDTTDKMQLLNEAKLILLDPQAREKYDYQYRKYTNFRKAKEDASDFNDSQRKPKNDEPKSNSNSSFGQQSSFSDFDIDDEVLRRWTNNARKQAVNLAKQTIEEINAMSKEAIKEGGKAMGNALVYQIILSIVIMMIIALSKSCK